MARTPTRIPPKRRTKWRITLILLPLIAATTATGWWWWRHWQPDPAFYPQQGIAVGTRDGVVDWAAARAIGARFVYLDATAGAFAREPGFTAALGEARAAALRVGAVHRYDPCQPAERQAANFMTLVPRDPALLPPAVDLSVTADACPVAVHDGTVESELTVFLNQIERHAGQPPLLRLSPAFERRHHIAARFDAPLWLSRDWLRPDYAGRPWALWTANAARSTEAAERPLRWLVAQP